MFLCDVVDQFLNKDCLADTGTPKPPDVTPFCIRGKQIDYFSACFLDLYFSLQFIKFRCFTVNRISSLRFRNCILEIDMFTQYVEYAAKRYLTDRYRYRLACIRYFSTAL